MERHGPDVPWRVNDAAKLPVCIYLGTNMFTGLGANGSEADFQNCAHEKHVIYS